MFYNDLRQTMLTLSKSSFVDDKIHMNINSELLTYLSFIKNLDGTYLLDYSWKHSDGCTIYKNERISLDNRINPDSINLMINSSKSIINYMSTNWRVVTRDPSKVTIHNTSLKSNLIIEPDKYIDYILKHYNFIERIKFIDEDKLNLRGEMDDILRFSRCLQVESIVAQTTPAIIHLMCIKNLSLWYKTHDVPNEIIDRIVILSAFLLAPYPITL